MTEMDADQKQDDFPDEILVIGLVGPLGVDLKIISENIQQLFGAVGWRFHEVRLSALIEELSPDAEPAQEFEDERIERLMTQGDQLRERHEKANILAIHAIKKIRDFRKSNNDDQYVFVVNSIKHPSESRLLRDLYGQRYVQISVYQREKDREEALLDRVRSSRGKYDASEFVGTVRRLMKRDEREANTEFGQSVLDIFHQSHFFVDLDNESSVRDQIHRFRNLLLGKNFITPTKDEIGLFFAKAASLKSADLSRQVGCCIMSEKGELIATGCNEVPAVGGGYVWETVRGDYNTGLMDRDNRDFVLGYDFNARQRYDIIVELFDKMKSKGYLADQKAGVSVEDLAKEALVGEDSFVKQTRAGALLEFGRVVHAEMNALMEAARRGVSVEGAVLYSTTFPCHMCARHIIAAGIKSVVYIEPYEKSMALDQYKSMIEIAKVRRGVVNFRPFVGFSPSRFITFFESGDRKDANGHVREYQSEPNTLKLPAPELWDLLEEAIADGALGGTD